MIAAVCHTAACVQAHVDATYGLYWAAAAAVLAAAAHLAYLTALAAFPLFVVYANARGYAAAAVHRLVLPGGRQ